MNRKHFQDVVFVDPHLAKPIRQAAEAGRAKQFGVVSEAAVVALMFPIVTYVVKNIGLPWLYD